MMRDINLQEAFERIAHDVNDDGEIENCDNDDDILPPPAQEMGHEAKVRFLKAKVRVLQEVCYFSLSIDFLGYEFLYQLTV